MIPLILHAPHSSMFIPPHLRDDILLSDSQLEAEMLAMTDRYTDDLYALPGITMITSPVSRLIVDMERFRDDREEEMAQVGMGAVYERTANGHLLRTLDPAIRESYLRQYYDPYHASFEAAVAGCLAEHNKCLIIDCHSFPSRALPYEGEQLRPRPQICLGTCDYHTPLPLLDCLQTRFSEFFTVDLNHPFAGTFVPGKFYRSDKRVSSIMIEVSRGLYMDEITGDKLDSYDNLKGILANILQPITTYI